MGTSASVHLHPRNLKPSAGKEFQKAIPKVTNDEAKKEESSRQKMEPNELITPWMDGENLLRRFLERGDLVEIRRSSYIHWAVFIGHINSVPLIVHISTESSDLGASTKKELAQKLVKGCAAAVRSDPFLTIVGTDQCRINNSLDAQRRPFPPSIVVERALIKLGTGGYNIIRNNCEHFAKWCRYALRESDQGMLAHAGMIGTTAMAISASAPIGIAVGTSSYIALRVWRATARKFRVWSII